MGKYIEFMRLTGPRDPAKTPQETGVPQPPLELPIPEGAVLIPLAAAETLAIPPADLRVTIEKRRTLRKYQPDPLSLAELTYLLWLTQGVKEITGRPATLRNVPSAGARHAFETYLLVNRVEGLEPGLYRYAASQNALLHLDASSTIREAVTRAAWDQQQVGNSAVTFIWVAVADRMYWRYVERGFRYLFLDAGHVCQNLYLAAEAIGAGACAIGSINDELMTETLRLDGENEFVVYMASVGKR